jgi:hypothetical protein
MGHQAAFLLKAIEKNPASRDCLCSLAYGFFGGSQFFYYYYSYVHTMLGSFLLPPPTPFLTTHPAPSLYPSVLKDVMMWCSVVFTVGGNKDHDPQKYQANRDSLLYAHLMSSTPKHLTNLPWVQVQMSSPCYLMPLMAMEVLLQGPS